MKIIDVVLQVRETRKALRDSERELEKMSVGHHIYDRGHEVEKHRNTRSGHIEEMQNFHNIDESKYSIRYDRSEENMIEHA